MILGLHGKKQSGKDTTGAYLVKHHGFERRAFADPLKQSLAALLDIPVARLEKYKNDPTIKLEIMQYPGDHLTINKATLKSMNFREALQRYGTESHREIIDTDIWIDKTLPVGGYYKGADIVLTDVRFPNEAERIQKLSGFTILIDRPTDMIDTHVSELEIPDRLIDYVLPNEDSILDLYESIEIMLRHLKRD